MTRTAILSDIHGNYEGLLAALRDAERQGCERVLCLGDLVDGGPGDFEVVEEIRRRGIVSVRGNHDEDFDFLGRLGVGSTVSKEALARHLDAEDYLRSLPERIAMDGMLLVHISPDPEMGGIKNSARARWALGACDAPIAFVGHVHVPMFFEMRGATDEVVERRIEYDLDFPIEEANRYVICPGAVGYSRDGVDRIRYGIHDAASGVFRFRMIDGPVIRGSLDGFNEIFNLGR